MDRRPGGHEVLAELGLVIPVDSRHPAPMMLLT